MAKIAVTPTIVVAEFMLFQKKVSTQKVRLLPQNAFCMFLFLCLTQLSNMVPKYPVSPIGKHKFKKIL